MKRLFIFISLHLFLFLLVIVYQAQAQSHILEEEWSIDKLDSMSYARVSGEVIHGDNLNFFIQSKHNCEKVWNNFTFVTYKNPGDIKQLLHKHIPITINGEELTAEVEHISPFLKLGWRVLFTIGVYPIKEYIDVLNNFYIEEKKYEIEIIDGIDFKAEKYFDIPINSWKLDKLVPSVLEAYELCKQIDDLES